MRARPVRLNATIAWLFMIGSACFALGTVPAYASAVGATADAITFFIGSLFFTSASFSQLVQAQSERLAHEIAVQQKVAAVLTADQRAKVRERLSQAPSRRGGFDRRGGPRPGLGGV